MDPLPLAKQLAKSLAENDIFLKYKDAKINLEKHEAAKLMLEDFRKKQIELEQKRLNGDILLEPYQKEMEKLASVISMNPFVRDFLMAEYQFMNLYMEIQRTINDALGLPNPQEMFDPNAQN